FTPSVRTDYTWIKDEGYTEKGSSANLKVDSRSTDELILGLDGKLSHEFMPGTRVSANLGVGYDALNSQVSITSSFAGAPGASFTTRGLEPSPWLQRAGLGLTTNTDNGVEISLRYDAEHRESFLNQTASVKLRWDI
ncbi:autotransporter domain-containing protein, partial [Pseudomonas sp.]|uniref:autotransporter outer membrane beta-barrel domain-containing protein n=1 Tax=Pseudomonas sp. TaxID=306 RepID=UPI0035617CD9